MIHKSLTMDTSCLRRYVTVSLMVMLSFLTVSTIASAAEDANDNDQAGLVKEQDVGALLSGEIGEGQAIVWYLLHCGYAVRTESKLLIFDYVHRIPWLGYEEPDVRSLSTGHINPDEIKGLDVYVFVTHPHQDHYDNTVFGWADTIPNITYFFGWTDDDTKPYNCLPAPRASFDNGEISVHTINSHHSGVPEVAYLVTVDDFTIYHGGDYNAEYKEDMAYLSQYADKADIAFLNDWCGEPIMEAINVLKPDVVFPGHCGGEELEPRKLPDCCRELDTPVEVLCPTHRGHLFRYDRSDH